VKPGRNKRTRFTRPEKERKPKNENLRKVRAGRKGRNGSNETSGPMSHCTSTPALDERGRMGKKKKIGGNLKTNNSVKRRTAQRN